MNYQVRILPSPTVGNPQGNIVAEARVLEISFRGETVETSRGKLDYISGAGVAKILVDGETIRGVSLC